MTLGYHGHGPPTVRGQSPVVITDNPARVVDTEGSTVTDDFACVVDVGKTRSVEIVETLPIMARSGRAAGELANK